MSEKDVRYLALGGAAVVITLLVGIATGWNLITLVVGAVLVGSVLALRIFTSFAPAGPRRPREQT
jgi:hypothetical protein